MKQIALILALGLIALPASAQNSGHIARAKHGASCVGCNLFQADFSNLELKGKSFKGARLRQADLSLGTFNRTNFSGADMRDVDASAALFSHSNFTRANLTNANFVGAYLEHTNFNGANLTGVNFSGAEMSSAYGLTQRQMDRACGDASTQMPRGLRIPVCN